MSLYNIVCVIGTRPEALKMIPVIEALQRIKKFAIHTIITGQHRELLSQILGQSNISIDANFDVMTHNQSLNLLSANLLMHFDRYLDNNRCDLIIAQGDTTTTLISSLSAFYKKIPFAHVEAGLRTTSINDPFPEEFNRRTTSIISDLHFCPTYQAAENLRQAGITQHIYITGNTIIDMLLNYSSKITAIPNPSRKMILVTCHRRENFGQPLLDICQALKLLAQRNPTIDILLLVHPNPNIKTVVEHELAHIPNIVLSEPLDYTQLVTVLKKSYLVLTDSGGLQEEAPALNKPVLVLRNSTERPEGIANGASLLVGSNIANIIKHVETLLVDNQLYQKMSLAGSPYGDGQAAERIAHIIYRFLVTRHNNKVLENELTTSL